MVYIDTDYKCYAETAEGRRVVENDFFDNKCREFIEGYRYIPSGETWIREDGVAFRGEMSAPWKDSRQLELAQLRFELDDTKSALAVLGVTE